MLTNDVKRNIDNARNVLVGKIPNPQSQIDQITTALIYKFMYDMDTQSREMGGKASFLTGDLKKYAWNRYFDDSLSADEKFNLYDDALRTFATAKKLPELFRQIFKDAFLPYRDARVLRLFLREINKFQYDHSEVLGSTSPLSLLGHRLLNASLINLEPTLHRYLSGQVQRKTEGIVQLECIRTGDHLDPSVA